MTARVRPKRSQGADGDTPSGDTAASSPLGAGAGRGVRVPQQARSRRTRRKVVEAAMYCFEELGYDGVKIQALREAGVIA